MESLRQFCYIASPYIIWLLTLWVNKKDARRKQIEEEWLKTYTLYLKIKNSPEEIEKVFFEYLYYQSILITLLRDAYCNDINILEDEYDAVIGYSGIMRSCIDSPVASALTGEMGEKMRELQEKERSLINKKYKTEINTLIPPIA